MFTLSMFQDALENYNNPKQPDLTIEQKKNKYIAYFRSNRSKFAVGNSESEALENLRQLLR